MVSPVGPPARPGWTTPPDHEAGERLRSILVATCRHSVGPWWEGRGYDATDSELLVVTGTAEGDVRPPSAVALGLASAAFSAGVSDGEIALPEGEIARRAARLAASLAATHATSRPGGWGYGWQTPLWASYVGLAAWLCWDQVAGEHRPAVVGMIEAEADAVAAAAVPYHRDRAGRVLTPGDTKAEESSWRARVLHLATAMLPEHPRRSAWTQAAIALLVSAYARPADVWSGEVLHGRPLRERLGGSNVDDDGLLVNHGRLHPDYMVVPHHAAAALHAALAGQPLPRAALHGLDLVYAALADRFYRLDGSIHYPEGSDWGTGRRIHFLLNDVQARVLGFDWRAETSASRWERVHGDAVLAQLARSDDGRVYVEPDEFRSAQREEEAAERAGQAYLFHQLGRRGRLSRTNSPIEDPPR